MFDKARRVDKNRKRVQSQEKDIGMWIRHAPEHEFSLRQQSDESLRGWENAQP
jgi:hypothetical protein